MDADLITDEELEKFDLEMIEELEVIINSPKPRHLLSLVTDGLAYYSFETDENGLTTGEVNHSFNPITALKYNHSSAETAANILAEVNEGRAFWAIESLQEYERVLKGLKDKHDKNGKEST